MAHRDADVAVARAAAAEGHPVRLLEPGVAPDGGDGARDGRRAALVPALLEHVERARREPRLTGGGCGCSRDRPHARHDDARLAHPRPRPRRTCRSCAARASPSTRATRCSSRRSRRRCARSRRRAAASRSRRSRRSSQAVCVSRARGSRTSAPGSRGRPCGASSRRTRGRRSRGTTSRSSASGHGCRSCSRGSSTPPTRSRRSSTGWTGSSSRTTADARSTARSRRWTRCRRSSRPSAAASRSSSTAAFAPAPTSSARSRSAPPQSGSDGRTCGASLQAARTACARSSGTSRADFDLTHGPRGFASVADIGPRQRHARVSAIEAVVFDLDGVHRRLGAPLGRGARGARPRARRPLARPRAGGHDGHELAGVVALHARRDRALRVAGGDQRRGRAADARALRRATSRSSTARSTPSRGSRSRSASRSRRRRTAA